MIELPHKEPQQKGNCHVYVIWGPNFTNPERYAKTDISKYGMTCKSDCEDRPATQVAKFNKEDKAPIIQNGTIEYDWTWLFRDKSAEVCRLIEKSLTAAYVKDSNGKLPPKHGLPCLIRDKDWDSDKEGKTVEVERYFRALKWINDQISIYGK